MPFGAEDGGGVEALVVFVLGDWDDGVIDEVLDGGVK